MLRLPSRIVVTLAHPSGQRLSEANVLIGINLLLSGRYYYGNLVGLTDKAGAVGVDGEQIERRYAGDQNDSPMDYKVELIECDSVVEIVLLAHEDVQTAITALEGSVGQSAEFRDMYLKATNQRFAPALHRCIADVELAQTLSVTLTTARMPGR